MLSPLHKAFLIESKIVSMVSSACFWVSWRLATRMAIRSLFSIVGLRAGSAVENIRRIRTLTEVARHERAPASRYLKRAGAHLDLPRPAASVQGRPRGA